MSEPVTAQRIGHAALSALVVLALTMLALYTFERSYSDHRYLVVGLIGAAVPTVLAVGFGLRPGAHVTPYAVTTYVLFLPLATVASFGSLKPSAFVDLVAATVDAPRILLTTVPPVDANGAVLVVPLTLAYVSAAVASWLALHSRRAVVPVVPILICLVLCVLFGTEETAGLVGKSTIFAAVALAWVAWRAATVGEVEHSARGAVVRAGLTGALLAALVWVIGPSVGSVADRVVLRGLFGSGYDVSASDNPLSDLQSYQGAGSSSLRNQRLLTVRGLPRSVPLRFTVLDTYDGEQWVPGNNTVAGTREDRYDKIASQVGTTVTGRDVQAQVRLTKAWPSDWLPLAGYLTRLDFPRLDDVRYNPATGTATLVNAALAERYEFDAVAPDTELPADAEPYPHDEELQPEGAFLDEELAVWHEVGAGPIDRVLLVAEYLRANADLTRPSTKADAAPSQERLERFASRAIGDGQEFASYLALAANRLGVPARVVVGARPGTDGVVRGRDVEAWVELRIADGSWRTLPTDSFSTADAPKRTEPRQTPQQFVKEKQKAAQPPPSGKSERNRRDQPDARDDLTDDTQGGGVPWRLLLSLLLAGALVAAIPLAKLIRRRVRRGREGVEAVVGAWRDVLDQGRDLGFTVRDGAPRPAQAIELDNTGALALATRVDDAVFAAGLPPDNLVREVWSEADVARAELTARASRRRRLLAWWNPASFR